MSPTRNISAVILAAGRGMRLRPQTRHCPKPLTPINGTPILHNALRQIAAVGIARATIIVGYQKDVIIASCGTDFAGLEIAYVTSDRYAETGTSYSLRMARAALLEGDMLILEGDVVFDAPLLERLLHHQDRDVAAVTGFTEELSGSVAILNDDRRIVRIRSVHRGAIAGPNAYKVANIFLLRRDTIRSTLVPTLDRLPTYGPLRESIEDVFNTMISDANFNLRGVDCSDLRWYEVDDANDLIIAERMFAAPPTTDASTCVAPSASRLTRGDPTFATLGPLK